MMVGVIIFVQGILGKKARLAGGLYLAEGTME
jgi:hypothetical protein